MLRMLSRDFSCRFDSEGLPEKVSVSEEFLLEGVFSGLLFEFLFLLVKAFLGTHGLSVFRLLEATGIDERLSKLEVNILCIGCNASLALINRESHAEKPLGVC